MFNIFILYFTPNIVIYLLQNTIFSIFCSRLNSHFMSTFLDFISPKAGFHIYLFRINQIREKFNSMKKFSSYILISSFLNSSLFSISLRFTKTFRYYSSFIIIVRLSAKGTNASWNALADFRFSILVSFWYYSFIRLTHYRTRRGEWRSCITAPPHNYLLSVIR